MDQEKHNVHCTCIFIVKKKITNLTDLGNIGRINVKFMSSPLVPLFGYLLHVESHHQRDVNSMASYDSRLLPIMDSELFEIYKVALTQVK